MRKQTLCWECAKVGSGACSWDKRLEPVAGWEAEKTALMMGNGRSDHSYCVISCPLFERDCTLHHWEMPTILTAEQRELIYKLVKLGNTTKEIAETTGIEPKTVQYHRTKLMRGTRKAARV